MTLSGKLLAKIPNNQASGSQWCNDVKVIEEIKHSGVELESCNRKRECNAWYCESGQKSNIVGRL